MPQSSQRPLRTDLWTPPGSSIPFARCQSRVPARSPPLWPVCVPPRSGRQPYKWPAPPAPMMTVGECNKHGWRDVVLFPQTASFVDVRYRCSSARCNIRMTAALATRVLHTRAPRQSNDVVWQSPPVCLLMARGGRKDCTFHNHHGIIISHPQPAPAHRSILVPTRRSIRSGECLSLSLCNVASLAFMLGRL